MTQSTFSFLFYQNRSYIRFLSIFLIFKTTLQKDFSQMKETLYEIKMKRLELKYPFGDFERCSSLINGHSFIFGRFPDDLLISTVTQPPWKPHLEASKPSFWVIHSKIRYPAYQSISYLLAQNPDQTNHVSVFPWQIYLSHTSSEESGLAETKNIEARSTLKQRNITPLQGHSFKSQSSELTTATREKKKRFSFSEISLKSIL